MYLVIIYFVLLSIFLKKMFFPNGHDSLSIIYNLAQKEFGTEIINCKEFTTIKKNIIGRLKSKKNELEEYRLKTLAQINHQEINDYGNYMSVKFSYWSLIIAVLLSTFHEILFEELGVDKMKFTIVVVVFFTGFLILMAKTIHYQHDQLEYLRFKLLCINEIAEKGNRR